jgi:hypothetical protein
MSEITEQAAKQLGYFPSRLLPTGEVAGIRSFIFTWGLVVGLDLSGYRTRFCYGSFYEAVSALMFWDGTGDPPGNWIKEKGAVERSGPG